MKNQIYLLPIYKSKQELINLLKEPEIKVPIKIKITLFAGI